MKRIATILIVLLALVVGAVALTVYAAGRGWLGTPEAPGVIEGARLPQEVLDRAERVQRRARAEIAPGTGKRILFGDFHVHTTFSVDAFLTSLPALQGEGAHPVADACDFARYCSGLDFWSINDHAESLTPRRWSETVDSIRRCNEIAGGAGEPDLVSFLGWEWTQVGRTPDDHYGHKNVVIADIEEGQYPTRPIASISFTSRAMAAPPVWQLGALAVFGGGGRLYDLARHLQDRGAVAQCDEGIPAPQLPADCLEGARTPAELFRKLDEWGHRSIVIPHGTTWGFYTPPGSTWDKQLVGDMHDPNRQTLIEVYSGHGNSEEYRDWRAVDLGGARPECPEPSDDYLPTCWQAGEIIRARCEAEGLTAEECEVRAADARNIAAANGLQAHLTVPGAEATEFLDAGQCRDCFQPAFNLRPGGSVQYITALTNFDDPQDPRRFRFGFMASSDNHTARPGTGYKEYARRSMTEATGARDQRVADALAPPAEEPVARAKPFDLDSFQGVAFGILEAERQASFFLTGGLVAVHSEAKNRDSIWDALQRREVYGTSGPRILLWFDMVSTEDELPMGSAVAIGHNPVFRVRALGSLEQRPGCPQHTLDALSSERVEHLCHGECYNPSDRRRAITRIEVVRIRPQQVAGEPVAPLIEDPWRTIACEDAGAGCEVGFVDLDFVKDGRDSLYYVRAIEEPTQAVNAANLRCERDAKGNCTKSDPCYGDFRTEYDDDCLAMTEQRAWSSPIYVDYAAPAAAAEPAVESPALDG